MNAAPESACTPEWEPDAVRQVGLLFHWRCACGAASLAPYIAEENARSDFVKHVLDRKAAPASAGCEHPRLVQFLHDIVTSPDSAVFAILTDNHSRVLYDVLRPMQEIAEEGMSRADHSSWRVFGRRLYLVDREDRLRGMRLHGIWLHSRPQGMPLVLVMSRLVEGGQLRG